MVPGSAGVGAAGGAGDVGEVVGGGVGWWYIWHPHHWLPDANFTWWWLGVVWCAWRR